MGEMKPTPGPWWTDEYGTMRHGHARARDTVPVHGVALIGGNIDTERGLQADSNTRLLFEAGTVFHNTGLSPVQLVEQRDELLSALLTLDLRLRNCFDLAMDAREVYDSFYQDIVRAAIEGCPALAKCEGVGNE